MALTRGFVDTHKHLTQSAGILSRFFSVNLSVVYGTFPAKWFMIKLSVFRRSVPNNLFLSCVFSKRAIKFWSVPLGSEHSSSIIGNTPVGFFDNKSNNA